MALPTDLFYNTGIATYVWLLTNRKAKARRGKVQLIDASGERFWKSLRKNLGSKRREIPPEARNTIVRIFHDMANGGGDWSDVSKIFDTEDFGYREWCGYVESTGFKAKGAIASPTSTSTRP